MPFRLALAALIPVLFAATPLSAAEFTVNMVNKDATGRAMQFEPAFLKVAPGDVVHFVSVDKGHNSEAMAGGFPEGAEGWKGKISQNVDVTFSVEGLYAVKCTPHFPLGMVGLVQVGDSQANLDAIKALKFPGKAKVRIAELLVEAGVPAP